MKTIELARASLGAAIVVVLATSVGAANAKESRDVPTDEAGILSTAQGTMNQAIAAAEKATGGKATGLAIKDQNGVVCFDVTIFKDNARQKVLVDLQSGNVVKILAAQNDSDSESNKRGCV